MTNLDVVSASARQLATAVASGEVLAADIASGVLARLDEVNPTLNAVIECVPETTLAQAAARDELDLGARRAKPLLGVPFTLKEVTQVDGASDTLGVPAFKGRRGTRDGVLYRRLVDAGAVYVGKTHQAQAGFAGISDNTLHGLARNPWRTDSNAGGSSSGAAIAVATGIGPIAEGGDGAGSIRIPAAMCGVVGFKPSLGHIPNDRPSDRFGSSFIFHGPLGRSVDDVRMMYDVMTGYDDRDPFSQLDPGHGRSLARPVRVAWSNDFGLDVHVDTEVLEICRDAIDAIAPNLADIVTESPAWGEVDVAQSMWNGLWVPSFRYYTGVLDGTQRSELHPHLQRLLTESESLTLDDYQAGVAGRSAVYDVLNTFLIDVDIVATPTLAVAGFEAEEFTPAHLRSESLRDQLLGWLLTYPANMAGVPAISIPVGMTRSGYPVGLQLVARQHRDRALLDFAEAVADAHGFIPDYQFSGSPR